MLAKIEDLKFREITIITIINSINAGNYSKSEIIKNCKIINNKLSRDRCRYFFKKYEGLLWGYKRHARNRRQYFIITDDLYFLDYLKIKKHEDSWIGDIARDYFRMGDSDPGDRRGWIDYLESYYHNQTVIDTMREAWDDYEFCLTIAKNERILKP